MYRDLNDYLNTYPLINLFLRRIISIIIDWNIAYVITKQMNEMFILEVSWEITYIIINLPLLLVFNGQTFGMKLLDIKMYFIAKDILHKFFMYLGLFMQLLYPVFFTNILLQSIFLQGRIHILALFIFFINFLPLLFTNSQKTLIDILCFTKIDYDKKETKP